ncbi:MAG: P1 family peptidase, partial [bacterium]
MRVTATKSNPESLDALCDVPGIHVGHVQNDSAKTGCSVILPENGAVAGVDVRGSAPGTREIELLRPIRLVSKIHALLLTGGSAFGLDAAGGVQQFLEEKQIGYDAGVAKVPIVPTAVIFDLAVGDAKIRPTRQMGYQAASAATDSDASLGRVGAGCGATVG